MKTSTKILVFSDSHGRPDTLRTAIGAHSDADTVIFLGDGAADAIEVLDEFPHVGRCVLAGNCDSRHALSAFGEFLQSEAVLQIGDVRLFCLHGHTRHAKSGYGALLYAASEAEADAVLFGHTHIPENEYVPDPGNPARQILLFNPGSVGLSHFHTYGILTVEKKKITATHGRALCE